MKEVEVPSIEPKSAMDGTLRLIIAVLLFGWNWLEGAIFENEYPKAFVSLYPIPLWRIALLILFITGALWCPTIGLLLAFAIFFYTMDMEVTLDKWNA